MKHAGRIASAPSLCSSVGNFGLVLPFKHEIDVHLTLLAILSSLWSSIIFYHQSTQQQGGGNSLLTSSLYQQSKDKQEAFKAVFDRWCDGLDPAILVLHERQLMCLHVEIENVQLLGGKAGEAEAHRVVPILASWVQRRESLHALWHAGQVIRAIGRFDDSPSAASVVAVYHASLVLWAYSILVSAKRLATANAGPFLQRDTDERITLNGEYDARHLVTLGSGKPLFLAFDASQPGISVKYVPIHDGRVMMNSIAEFLVALPGATNVGQSLPLVANLARLMIKLGNATSDMSQECVRLVNASTEAEHF